MPGKPTYDELEQSAKDLDRIFNFSADMIGSGNLAGYFTKINPSFSKTLGYPEEELLAKPFLFFIHDDDVEKTKAALAEAARENQDIYIENRYRCKDGSYKWIEWKVLSIVQENKFIAVGRDITQRKLAEAALRKSEGQLLSVFRVAPTGIGVVIDRVLKQVNERICEMTGYSKEELTGQNARILYPRNEDYEYVGSEKYRQITARGSGTVETHWKHKAGHIVDVLLSSTPMDLGDLSKGVIFTALDITDRKQVEKERNLLATAIEHAAESVMIANRQGEIQYANPSFKRLSGYTQDEIVGQNFRVLKSGKHNRDFYRDMWKEISCGNIWAGRITNTMKDGSLRQFETRISPVRDSSGEIVNFVSVNRDITQEVELGVKLQRAQKMEALGLLAGGVAHDLNNVLSGIVSYPDLLLLELPDDSPLKNPILTIKKSGIKAADIVQDLLTLARRGVSSTEILNLNDVILEYLKSPEQMKLANQYTDVRIETCLADDLFNIKGSEVHLRKTIMNLVLNAAEAQPSGGKISISTSNQYLDTPIKGYEDIKEGDFVVLEIADSGLGIAAADLDRIFEPFYTRKIMGRSGTGLGMAVVWGTVQDHHGFIHVESSQGKGTAFKLFFPVTRKKLEKERDSIPLAEYMGSGQTILVIDDVRDQREIAANILQKLNYAVAVASSGEAAVAYLQNKTVDLLILDMIMDNGIDGLETYKKIIALHPGQKAVIASGFSETDRVQKAQDLGAGVYVKKPYTLEKIGVAVRDELRRI